MSQTTNNSDNQEIDLSMISDKIKGFFDGIAASIFRSILFFKRNLLWFCGLTVIGVGIGVYLDTNNKSYDSEIIVRPNFGSTDYLYSKIELLNSKIKENDTLFLKSIGVLKPKNLSLIEIEPVIDIYSFVNNNPVLSNTQNSQNFELVKLLAEDSDINKTIKDKVTSKNYSSHKIHIRTKGFISDNKMIVPILNYLNQNEYFETLRKTQIQNVTIKMVKNEEIINQINGFLDEFSSSTKSNQKSEKLVYYNENTQLNDVIRTKENLLVELGNQRMELTSLDKFIKKTSSVVNIKNENVTNGNLKLVLPIFFIFGFIFIHLFSKFYNKQALKALQNRA
jgi:uncharacterized protein YfkK (UPF0435 family)